MMGASGAWVYQAAGGRHGAKNWSSTIVSHKDGLSLPPPRSNFYGSCLGASSSFILICYSHPWYKSLVLLLYFNRLILIGAKTNFVAMSDGRREYRPPRRIGSVRISSPSVTTMSGRAGGRKQWRGWAWRQGQQGDPIACAPAEAVGEGAIGETGKPLPASSFLQFSFSHPRSLAGDSGVPSNPWLAPHFNAPYMIPHRLPPAGIYFMCYSV